MTKAAIIILCTAAGTVVAYGLFLFASLALLFFYGDEPGVRAAFLQKVLFYVIFGATTLVGFGVGILITKKRNRS